jgi:hypothetical protein
MADDGTPRGAAAVMYDARRATALTPRRAATTRRHRALGAAAIGVALLAAVTGVVALVADHDEPTRAVVGDAPASAPAPLYLVPKTVPEGFRLVSAKDGSPGSELTFDGGESDNQRWVKFDTDGYPAEVFDIQTRKPPAAGDPLPKFGPDGESEPTTVRGHHAEYDAARGILTWLERDDLVVIVSAGVARPHEEHGSVPLPREFLDTIAAGLRARGDGMEVSTAPAGFELVARYPGSGSDGTFTRTLTYSGPDHRTFAVQLVDDSDEPPGVNFFFADARRVEVRGQLGVLTPFLFAPPTSGDLYLQWTEPPNMRVTISGNGMTGDQLLAIARDLEPVDAGQWRQLVDPSTVQTTPSTAPVTAPTPTTVTAPPAPTTVTAPPSSSAGHFDGTYRGTEHYQLDTERCDYLDHDLVETFTLPDGTAWQFEQRYCGSVDGDQWTGVGTFTIDAPDGTLTGTVHDSATLPSRGEPYDIVVTGGTGRFAGATGSCHLDNHLRQLQFGTNEQWGSFSCAIEGIDR